MSARYLYRGPQPCGCNMDDGYCSEHSGMLKSIRDAVWNGQCPASLFDAVWALSDGYGEQGFVPEQGYDWSAIRDSSLDAIEAMSEVVR